MSGKTWLVGIDGSDVAYKALRLATMLMDPYEDQIKVLHLSDPQKEDPSAHPDTLMNNAEVELRRAQVGRTKWSIEHQTLREGWVLIGQLIYEANHLNNGNAVLVMGAQGKSADERPGSALPGMHRPKGQPPMGSVAEACLNLVKVPVVLVRGQAKALDRQEDQLATLRRGKRTLEEKGKGGGPKGGHGLDITVCVDGTNLSKKAFDMGLKMCRDGAGDHLTATHVDANEWVGRPPHDLEVIRQYYEAECSKAETNYEDLHAHFNLISKEPKHSLKDMLLEPLEKADVVVMGSIELSNFDQKVHLGSMAQAVAKQSSAHIMIVKNYAST